MGVLKRSFLALGGAIVAILFLGVIALLTAGLLYESRRSKRTPAGELRSTVTLRAHERRDAHRR